MVKNEPIRLQKFLAQCGVASRRKAEELIVQGKVKINGKTAVLGDKVNANDKVYVSGKRVILPKTKFRYIMLNKPRGFITTMHDERGRRCVAELVQNVGERVYPIGRLDKDSEGMLVFTNDGAFANKVMHPRNSIYKGTACQARNRRGARRRKDSAGDRPCAAQGAWTRGDGDDFARGQKPRDPPYVRGARAGGSPTPPYPDRRRQDGHAQAGRLARPDRKRGQKSSRQSLGERKSDIGAPLTSPCSVEFSINTCFKSFIRE